MRIVFAFGLLFGHAALAAELCENFSATGLDAATARQFRDDLYAALRDGASKKVASLVHYPLRVNLAGKKKTFKTANELTAAYGKVFTKDLVTRLLEAPETDTVCRDQGIGFANGTLWVHAPDFEKKPKVLRVVAVNPP